MGNSSATKMIHGAGNAALGFLSLVMLACGNPEPTAVVAPQPASDSIVYSAYSQLPNRCVGFHSPNAINALAHMENAYFRNYNAEGAGYYGTVWRDYAEQDTLAANDKSLYARYAAEAIAVGIVPDSMHCTIYAVSALEAGLGQRMDSLETLHRQVYKDHEHAGWSIGYLLVRHFGWQAWLVIERDSPEFARCEKEWKRRKVYPVWRQPAIPLQGMLVKGEQDSAIQALLMENEFGWGFSHQGIHTWVTRFDTLKECNWLGAPARKFEHRDLIQQDQLFAQTPFLSFGRYASHVVIFPPKER